MHLIILLIAFNCVSDPFQMEMSGTKLVHNTCKYSSGNYLISVSLRLAAAPRVFQKQYQIH